MAGEEARKSIAAGSPSRRACGGEERGAEACEATTIQGGKSKNENKKPEGASEEEELEELGDGELEELEEETLPATAPKNTKNEHEEKVERGGVHAREQKGQAARRKTTRW